MIFREALESLTAAELNEVVDADIDSVTQRAPDAVHMFQYLQQTFPELYAFAEDTAGRLGLGEEETLAELIPVCVALAAMCRALESRDLPQ